VWRRPCHKRIVCGDWRFFRWLVVIYTGRHHGFSVGWRWGLTLVWLQELKSNFGICKLFKFVDIWPVRTIYSEKSTQSVYAIT
jgi:hypothetical protein